MNWIIRLDRKWCNGNFTPAETARQTRNRAEYLVKASSAIGFSSDERVRNLGELNEEMQLSLDTLLYQTARHKKRLKKLRDIHGAPDFQREVAKVYPDPPPPTIAL